MQVFRVTCRKVLKNLFDLMMDIRNPHRPTKVSEDFQQIH